MRTNPLQQQMKQQISPEELMEKSTEIKCQCGCKYFIEVAAVRKVSRIAMPQLNNDAVFPVPVLLCNNCKTELKLIEL